MGFEGFVGEGYAEGFVVFLLWLLVWNFRDVVLDLCGIGERTSGTIDLSTLLLAASVVTARFAMLGTADLMGA